MLNCDQLEIRKAFKLHAQNNLYMNNAKIALRFRFWIIDRLQRHEHLKQEIRSEMMALAHGVPQAHHKGELYGKYSFIFIF